MSVIVDESRTLRSTWEDENGDPTVATVSFAILTPAGDIETPSVLNPSTGVYETIVSFDQPGNWYWEWTGATALGVKKCRGVVCATPSYVDAPTSP